MPERLAGDHGIFSQALFDDIALHPRDVSATRGQCTRQALSSPHLLSDFATKVVRLRRFKFVVDDKWGIHAPRWLMRLRRFVVAVA